MTRTTAPSPTEVRIAARVLAQQANIADYHARIVYRLRADQLRADMGMPPVKLPTV